MPIPPIGSDDSLFSIMCLRSICCNRPWIFTVL